MYTAKFKINNHPFSINSMYYNTRQIKTTAFRDWSFEIMHALNAASIQNQLIALSSKFDPKKHSYVVNLKFHYPEKIFYTKTGIISARSHDLSNIEKGLIDILFLSKNNDNVMGGKNLNIDDKYISKLISEKLATKSQSNFIDVSIYIIKLKTI